MTTVQGFQITFFTQQNRRHHEKAVAEWLVDTAHELGIRGATLLMGAEGFGHDRRLHSWRFFELSEQPVEVVMAVSADEEKKLFERLRAEKLPVFYIKSPVEFGTLGDDA